MPRAIVSPSFLAFSFFPTLCSLNCRCQKRCQQTLHYPNGCYPGPFLRLLFIFFFWLRLFLPFFLSVWATIFRWLLLWVCCQTWLFVKQSKNFKDKGRYLNTQVDKTVKPEVIGWEWTWNTNCQTVGNCKLDSHGPFFSLSLITLLGLHVPCQVCTLAVWTVSAVMQRGIACVSSCEASFTLFTFLKSSRSAKNTDW